MKKLVTLTITFLFLGMPLAFAVKIAKVDVQQVLVTINEGKRVQGQLRKTLNQREARMKEEENKIREIQKNFEKQSMVMNDKAKFQKEREIQERVVRFQQSALKIQREMQELEEKRKRPIIDKIKKTIDQVSKAKGYDLVFEAATAPIYVKSSSDATKEVIEAYNKKFK